MRGIGPDLEIYDYKPEKRNDNRVGRTSRNDPGDGLSLLRYRAVHKDENPGRELVQRRRSPLWTAGIYSGCYPSRELSGSQNDTWSGCSVSSTTRVRPDRSLSRSVSSRQVAPKAESTMAASYLLR